MLIEKTPLIPVFDIGSNKLDYRMVEKHLYTNQGKFTDFLKKYNFSDYGYQFEERPQNDKYSLAVKLTKRVEVSKKLRYWYELYIGQSGCFYRIAFKKLDLMSVHSVLAFVGQFNKEIEEICKQYVFEPYAVSHFSDGDYFIDRSEYERGRFYCKTDKLNK